jgi:hypothetical protein
LAFVKTYPKLNALIQECWRVRRKDRPNFDEITSRLQGDIGDEIKRKEEPQIELYSKEDDEIYRNRIGKEDEIEDSDGEEGGWGTAREKTATMRKEHEATLRAKEEQHRKVVAAKDKMLEELQEKMRVVEEALQELKEKGQEDSN